MTISIQTGTDTRIHIQCTHCQTDHIALTHNEARSDALRHRNWHLQKANQ